MSQTLDTIFCANASESETALALTDSQDRARFGLFPIEHLTYQQAHRYISHKSNFFRAFNFNEGDIIAVQMPSVVELPLILLSIMHAGLVPCLMPTHWRRTELDNAFASVGPKAIIGHAYQDGYNPFQTLFEIAAKHSSVRFVFGLGGNQIDGVTPLEKIETIINDETSELTKTQHKRTSDHAAIIDWQCGEKGKLIPITHTHRTLIANAIYFLEQTGNLNPSSILTTNSLNNITGVISGVIPWILSGTALHIAASLNHNHLAGLITKQNADLAIIPEFLANDLSSALNNVSENAMKAPHLGLVSSPLSKPIPQSPQISEGSTTSIFSLNGLCLYVISNQETEIQDNPFKHEIAQGQTANENGVITFETRLHGSVKTANDMENALSGELELAGAAIGFGAHCDDMTSYPLPSDELRWEKTNLQASISGEAMSLIAVDQGNQSVYYGNTVLNGSELDKLYQSFSAFLDAAAFTLKDPLIGHRLFAAIIPSNNEQFSYQDFKQFLHSQNISPIKVPEKLVMVSEIPRDENGSVIRSAIASNA